MSTEASASSKQTSEQDVEVQQEELQSAAKSEEVEQAHDKAEDGTESAGSDDSSDQSVVTAASTQSQYSTCSQEFVLTGGAGTRDSPESSISVGGSGTESQQGEATGTDSTKKLQQGGATGGVPRKLSQESTASITESQQGCGSGTESQLLGAVGGTSREESPESSVSAGGSGTESQQGGATGGVPRQLSQESTASITESQKGCGSGTESPLLGAVGGTSRQDSQGSAAAYSSSIGDSQETALVCDSGSRGSLESGVAGGVSSSPDTLPSIDTRSSDNARIFDAIRQFRQRSFQAEFRENVDERAQESEGSRNCDQCFYKCSLVCGYLRTCSRWIRNSKIFMFIKIVLLILPISALCMGLKYLGHCPVGSELPILMMSMGIAGFILIGSGLALDVRGVLCPSVHRYYFKAPIIVSRVLILALFAAGLVSTYKMAPSFDPSTTDSYCDMVFYYYAYYTNFVVIGIAVLSFFIYVPTYNENFGGYVHF